MSLLLPLVGITSCERAIALVENSPNNIIGTFWVMSGYNLDLDAPSWWIDLVLKENQAQSILDAYERGMFDKQHDGDLYLGFCIIATAARDNPANISYVVQHLRMNKLEGVPLLKLLANHNIPAITEVTYPESYLSDRYDHDIKRLPESLTNIRQWSVQTWEDYCSYLMAYCGQRITARFWEKQ